MKRLADKKYASECKIQINGFTESDKFKAAKRRFLVPFKLNFMNETFDAGRHQSIYSNVKEISTVRGRKQHDGGF